MFVPLYNFSVLGIDATRALFPWRSTLETNLGSHLCNLFLLAGTFANPTSSSNTRQNSTASPPIPFFRSPVSVGNDTATTNACRLHAMDCSYPSNNNKKPSHTYNHHQPHTITTSTPLSKPFYHGSPTATKHPPQSPPCSALPNHMPSPISETTSTTALDLPPNSLFT